MSLPDNHSLGTHNLYVLYIYIYSGNSGSMLNACVPAPFPMKLTESPSRGGLSTCQNLSSPTAPAPGVQAWLWPTDPTRSLPRMLAWCATDPVCRHSDGPWASHQQTAKSRAWHFQGGQAQPCFSTQLGHAGPLHKTTLKSGHVAFVPLQSRMSWQTCP